MILYLRVTHRQGTRQVHITNAFCWFPLTSVGELLKLLDDVTSVSALEDVGPISGGGPTEINMIMSQLSKAFRVGKKGLQVSTHQEREKEKMTLTTPRLGHMNSKNPPRRLIQKTSTPHCFVNARTHASHSQRTCCDLRPAITGGVFPNLSLFRSLTRLVHTCEAAGPCAMLHVRLCCGSVMLLTEPERASVHASGIQPHTNSSRRIPHLPVRIGCSSVDADAQNDTRHRRLVCSLL